MKIKSLLLLALSCLFLSSCFEIEETYNLNADGSYTANYSLDMGQLIGMASSMAPDSVKQTADYKTAKDTLVNLGASMPDSVKQKMSAQEVALMKQTDMRMQMNMMQNLFKIDFSNKGKSIDELNYFLTNFGSALEKGKVGDLMKPKGMPAEESTGEPEVPFKNKEYDYIIMANSFQRKVKAEVFAAAKDKDKQVFEMMKSMNMKLSSTIIVNLPRPAKSTGNPNAILSADKKQVKLKLDMIEAIDKPEMLNFKIEY